MERIDEILATMQIPERRKTDWAWLIRNLGFQNSEHKDFQEVQRLIRQKYKDEWNAAHKT